MKIQIDCEHNFKWSYDCFEDAVIKEVDCIGIPVRCEKCGLEAIEWYCYSSIKNSDGNLIDN